MFKKYYKEYSCEFCGARNVKLWSISKYNFCFKPIKKKKTFIQFFEVCFFCIKLNVLINDFEIITYKSLGCKNLYYDELERYDSYKVKIRKYNNSIFVTKNSLLIERLSPFSSQIVFPSIKSKFVVKNKKIYGKKYSFRGSESSINFWKNLPLHSNLRINQIFTAFLE